MSPDGRKIVKGFMSHKDDPKQGARSSAEKIEILSSEVEALAMIVGLFMGAAGPVVCGDVAGAVNEIMEEKRKESKEARESVKYKAQTRLLAVLSITFERVSKKSVP